MPHTPPEKDTPRSKHAILLAGVRALYALFTGRAVPVREAAPGRPSGAPKPLPIELVHVILRLLPLEQRLRAREVCRDWRLFLEDGSFWTHVHLGVGCGVTPRLLNPRFLSDQHRSEALLRAACVRAKGGLQSVDLSGVDVKCRAGPFVPQWAQALSAANKANLRDLVAPHMLARLAHMTLLCRALPLCRVRGSVECNVVESLPVLRREPPFTLLTLDKLIVFGGDGEGELSVLLLASAISVYKGMEKLHIYDVRLTVGFIVDAVVDAAIAAGIREIFFLGCRLNPPALPALTRLLQSPGFERLKISNNGWTIFEGLALPAFCETLRNSKSLTALELDGVNLWDDLEVLSELFAALEGLPTLQKLKLRRNRTDEAPRIAASLWAVDERLDELQRAVGKYLARLIVRSNSLRSLKLKDNLLGEAGMTPIFQALNGSRTLSELSLHEGISADFTRDVVLPAVRANTSLRTLSGLQWVEASAPETDADEEDQDWLLPELYEVEDILQARRLADEEAA